ncbi:MAG TPA: TlpA disulfide reductase family protein [Anaerolineae bacterium]|nr:TlpA disulfide reductase family protein [Anaerolineae bacterium]
MEQAVTSPKSTGALKKVFLSIGLLAILGWVAIVISRMHDVESTGLHGQVAPDFTLTLFDQFDQDSITLSELRGQVVVINFWASWCVECFKEADLLEQAWREHQDRGVVFLGVDYLDTEKEAQAYMDKYNITYPSGPDLGSKISKDYAITGVPETIFIDKDGNIAHVQIGPIEHQQLYQLLNDLMAQPGQGT